MLGLVIALVFLLSFLGGFLLIFVIPVKTADYIGKIRRDK